MSGSDKPRLKLFFREQSVGNIRFDGEQKYVPEYSEKWIQLGFPISPHLPFDQDADSEAIGRFIQNLFPEVYAFEYTLAFMEN